MSRYKYPGIDYTEPGSTVNRDEVTGIRYGVISCHTPNPEVIYEAQEFDYGPPHCPFCGIEIPEDLNQGDDQVCPGCGGEDIDVSECYSDEPLGWSIQDAEYTIVDCLDNDAMIVKSPYYTYAQFCSPCVPGAGNLDNPFEGWACGPNDHAGWHEDYRREAEANGYPKVYCLGRDWFSEDSPCPYPIMFKVSNDEPVSVN